MKAKLFVVSSLVLLGATFAFAQEVPFYPLHIGDRWEFNGSLSKAFKDTVMPNGKTYVMIANSDTIFGETRYERYDSNKVFRFNTRTMKEELWFDFTKREGDTVSVIPLLNDTIKIVFADTLKEVIIGKSRKVWRFTIDSSATHSAEEIDVADSIGIAQYLKPDPYDDLDSTTISGAVINDSLIRVSYPFIYLPMQPGDWWKYDDSSVVSVIKDTLMPNGKSYAMFSDGTFERQDRYLVYFYDTLSQIEVIEMDMSAPARQVWDLRFWNGSLSSYTSDGIRTEPVFSTVKRTYSWEWSALDAWDVWVGFAFADSIGMIESGTFLTQRNLVEAEVNGKHYIATSIKPPRNDSPTEFLLGQNYPNPFNPTTMISYRISATGRVTLKIYDILGREVRTLVDEVKNPGRYEVRFDAPRLASGVYFYRLTAPGIIQVKKMLMTK